MQLCFKIRRSARKWPGKSGIAKKSEQKKATVGMFDNVLFDNSKQIMFD